MAKKPVKKKEVDLVVQKPPVFLHGMTEEEAVAFIGERIYEHRNNVGPKKPWKEDELLIRHQLIINWLGQGIPTMELARHMMNVWNIGDSSAFKFLQEAMKYLTESTDDYRDHMRQTQINKLERWAEECRLSGKYMEASKFTDQLNKLYGLYIDKQKLEVSSDGPITVSFDQ